jgi:hypothetical protein
MRSLDSIAFDVAQYVVRQITDHGVPHSQAARLGCTVLAGAARILEHRKAELEREPGHQLRSTGSINKGALSK